jgi:Tfp pilus assembly protein PilF
MSSYIGAYANRGLARLRQGKTVEAKQDFERYLALNKELKPLLEQRIKEVKEGYAVKW